MLLIGDLRLRKVTICKNLTGGTLTNYAANQKRSEINSPNLANILILYVSHIYVKLVKNYSNIQKLFSFIAKNWQILLILPL